jgi:multiple sugar transport system substrate-binding protein
MKSADRGGSLAPPAAGGLSRRSLLRAGLLGAGATALGGGLSGCGSPVATGLAGGELSPGTLTFWNLFGGGDGARLTTMLDNYAKEMGGPESLQAATFAWGNPYYTKVSLATLGDKPPDVAVAHLTRAKNLARAGLLTEITDDILGLVDLKPEDFNQKVWKEQQLDGKNWVVPLDTHPYVMYYNRKVCEPAGLLDSDGKLKPIEGVDAWNDALKAIKEVTGKYAVTTSNVNDTSTPWRWFYTLYSQQNGSPWLSNGGTELTFDEGLVESTLAFMQDLTERELMPRAADYAGAQQFLFTGESGFYMQGEWEITTAQSIKGLDFGMAPIPTIFDRPATQADSHTFILPKLDRDEAQMQRAMGFIKSMLDQGLIWAEGGHILAYLPTLESPKVKALSPQSDYASVADVAAYDDPAWYSGSGSNFEVVVGAQIGLCMQGIASPAEAISSIRSQLNTYANTADPL